MLTFPQLLKAVRKEAGLTQSQLAKNLDVSTILVTLIETGRKDPSKKFLSNLAERLQVHPGTIAPFIFSQSPPKKLSGIEKSLLELGSRLQIHLVKEKSKNLREN